jgi:membrane-bound lytic murein transglycosylase D
MINTSIKRALARRKIEAMTLGAIATLSAAGLVRQGEPSLQVSSVVSKVVHVEQAPAAQAASTPAGPTIADIDHPTVDSWIRRFTTSQRSSMATYLTRMTKYEDMISGKLASRELPQELIYLAMIESGFNPTAKSPVKAAGLWQFMSATAREYGLRVGGRGDERLNPSRSTDAALTYLSKLHDRFGSWYLAFAAYNTGQGRVARIMKQETGKTKGTDADFYRIAHRLPKETRDYVPKMIAAARIGSDPAKYGFTAGG